MPAVILRSMPLRYASAARRYYSDEKSSVMLIGTPEKIASSIACKPAGVPGILMKTFGRLTRRDRNLASAMVRSVSEASDGGTSRDTQPSRPFVACACRWKVSGALNVGDRQLEKKILSCPTLSRPFEYRSVIGVAILDGVVEDGRI